MSQHLELDFLLKISRLAKPDPPQRHDTVGVRHQPYSLTGSGHGTVFNIRTEYGSDFIEVPGTLLSQLEYPHEGFFHRESAIGGLHPALLTVENDWYVLVLSPEEWAESVKDNLTGSEMCERLGLTEEYASHCRQAYSEGVRSPHTWRERPTSWATGEVASTLRLIMRRRENRHLLGEAIG